MSLKSTIQGDLHAENINKNIVTQSYKTFRKTFSWRFLYQKPSENNRSEGFSDKNLQINIVSMVWTFAQVYTATLGQNDLEHTFI